MAVRIRLHRAGSTHRPFYRVVVADSRSPRDGRFIETVGYYDPLPETTILKIDTDRVKAWMEKGALPSDTVRSLISKAGTLPTAAEVADKARARRTTAIEEAARSAPPKPKPKPKAEAKPKPAAKPEAKVEPAAAAKPTAKVEPAAAAKPEAKPAPKPDVKPAAEAKAEAKPAAPAPATEATPKAPAADASAADAASTNGGDAS